MTTPETSVSIITHPIKKRSNRKTIDVSLNPPPLVTHIKNTKSIKKTKNLRSHYHSSIKQNTSSNCSKWKSKQHSVAVALDNINKTLPRKCDKRAGLNLTHGTYDVNIVAGREVMSKMTLSHHSPPWLSKNNQVSRQSNIASVARFEFRALTACSIRAKIILIYCVHTECK